MASTYSPRLGPAVLDCVKFTVMHCTSSSATRNKYNNNERKKQFIALRFGVGSLYFGHMFLCLYCLLYYCL